MLYFFSLSGLQSQKNCARPSDNHAYSLRITLLNLYVADDYPKHPHSFIPFIRFILM